MEASEAQWVQGALLVGRTPVHLRMGGLGVDEALAVCGARLRVVYTRVSLISSQPPAEVSPWLPPFHR